MAHQVQKDLVNDIGSNFLSMIADECTDINNQEQLTICLQWIDDTLEEHEDFLGIYLIPVVSVIKDAFIRLQLSLQNCRGQCYDGASNMLGKRSSLSVKDATSHCKILSDTVNNTNEIVKLVKFSPKRENLLGQIKSNIEMEDEEEGISESMSEKSGQNL